MSADDIKAMLTEQDIDDIILEGGHRNAAGGIYATSVYAFAKEIAVAAVEASRAAVAELPDSVLTEAASELRVCAEEIKAGHTIGGEWPAGEDDARAAYERLNALASGLEKMAAIRAIKADRASRAEAGEDPREHVQRILDAAFHWAEQREVGPSPAKRAWEALAQRIQAEFAIATDDAAPSPQGDAWKPIKRAPRDGSTILLRGYGDHRIADGYWLQAAYNGNGAWIWPYVHSEPAYWMPLPAEPTDAARSTPATEKGA